MFQDLATLSLMSITRNFFLGREPKKRLGPIQLFDSKYAAQVTEEELRKIGTHNVHHAWAVGDTFTVLNRGRSYGTFKREKTHREDLLQMMAGGEELDELAVELDLISKRDPGQAGEIEHRAAEELE